jgi:HAD superfamily hydrolase (TIGR01509 family)
MNALSELILAVIFDCDGTLIDSEAIQAAGLRSILKSMGIDISSEVLQQRFTGFDNASVLRQLSEETGIEFPTDTEAQIDGAAHELLARLARPMPGAMEILTTLTDVGVRLAVASNSTYRNVEAMMVQARLAHFFEERIATRDRVDAPKPAPDVYILAAKLAGTAPSRCLAIEDSPAGIAAARAAGMTVIGYRPQPGGFALPELHRAGASMVIDDLRALRAMVEGNIR